MLHLTKNEKIIEMRTIYKIVMPVVVVLLLASCSVPKEITITGETTPATYRNGYAADSNIVFLSWTDFFKDAGLQTLLNSAISNNNDMQVALKNIEAAQLVVRQSKLGYLPEAKLQVTGSVNRPSDNSLNGLSLKEFLGKSYIEDYSVSTVLSWEADIWGKIKSQKSKALAAYLQTTEAKKTIQTNLVSSVAKGYYNLLMLDEQVRIARRNLSLNDSTLAIVRLQFNAGQVTALAIQQTEAQRLVAAQLIPKLEQEINIQENALSILAGVSPAAVKRSSAINDSALLSQTAAGIPSGLLQNRPDVRSKELDVVISHANTKIARANMYPSLTITAAGGINAFKATNWFNIPASLFASAVGGITQPLFQRKQLKTQYELSKIEKEKSVISFRQTVLLAVGEVTDALVRNEKLQQQRALALTRVNTLQQATSNADFLFRNGLANYLEVITAQSNVLQAELDLALLRKEQQNAIIELYRSLGGGWK